MKGVETLINYAVPFCYWTGSDTISLIFFLFMFTIGAYFDIMYYKTWKSRQ